MPSESQTTPNNPFSTRFIRPGALPYLFHDGDDAGAVVSRLAGAGWRGQIVGPHGSGKSTLLCTLSPALEQAGRRPYFIQLHDDQRRLPRAWRREAQRTSARLIVVDGYEQLSAWQRMLLAATCHVRDWGMLVTAHADVGLTTVYRTQSCVRAAEAVVARLLTPADYVINRPMIAEQLAAAGGNIREMLLALYDVYEHRQQRT